MEKIPERPPAAHVVIAVMSNGEVRLDELSPREIHNAIFLVSLPKIEPDIYRNRVEPYVERDRYGNLSGIISYEGAIVFARMRAVQARADALPSKERTEAEARKTYATPALSTLPPIPMLLTCPACGERHIDEGEFATKSHHTHACQKCGTVWRPAIVPTCGVQFLPGFLNEKK